MKQYINNYQFHRAFERMGRGEQFSYEGLNALFNYIEEIEVNSGEEIQLDVISLCCEFMEYENLEELQNNYNNEYKTLEDIREDTEVINIEDSESFIIQQF